MAYSEGIEQIGTLKSTNDLSAAANQFRAVKLDTTAFQVVLAAAGTDILVGILDNLPGAGQVAQLNALEPGSIHKVKIGISQTVSVGSNLVATSTGDLGVGTTNDICVLKALEAVTTDGSHTAIISAICIGAIKL